MNHIVAIEAERMIDGRGGPPVEPALVVVDGERITAAGSPAQIKVPEEPGGSPWERGRFCRD